MANQVNAIEIRNLTKSFRGMYALDNFNMTVPVGAIYGFIGENGSGKSTTEKLICGHLVKNHGEIKLFGKDYTYLQLIQMKITQLSSMIIHLLRIAQKQHLLMKQLKQ